MFNTAVTCNMSPIISVFEHQQLTARDFSVASDFDWLIEQDFEVFGLRRQQGQWCLTVRQYLGVVRLPSGILLEILPKIAKPTNKTLNKPLDKQEGEAAQLQRTRVWVQQMLRDINEHDSARLKTKHFEQLSEQLGSSFTAAPSLSEWLLNEFITLMIGYLPLRQYEQETQNNACLQGKLLIKKQLQHNAHQPHRFFSESSQFTQSSISNRFIKQAWQQLLALVFGQDHSYRLPDSSQSPSSQYSSLALAKGDTPHRNGYSSPNLHLVSEQWRAIDILSNIEWQRLDTSYTQAQAEVRAAPVSLRQKQKGIRLLAFAHWLLSASTVTQSAGVGIEERQPLRGHTRAASLQLSLFINMNHAFERWVETTLRREIAEQAPSYQVAAQLPRVWLVDDTGQPCVTTITDLLLSYNNQPRLVIDVKWKSIHSSRDISASDAYQLAAYAQAYGVRKVWLVYPYVGSNESAAAHAHQVTASQRVPVRLKPNLNNTVHNSADNGACADFEIWLIPFDVTLGRIATPVQKKDDKIF